MHRRFLIFTVFLASGLVSAVGRAQEVRAPEPPPEFNPATEPTVVTVAKVMPAVVNIATERIVQRTTQDPFEQFFNQFFDDMTSNRRPHETQQTVTSLGSGFLVDEDGSIVTNEHVVERAVDLKIKVIFSDGTVAPARYVAGDPKADLALIRVDRKDHGGKPFPFINLAKPSPSLLGQTVLVLGNPLGYNSSVSRGILSANEREITVEGTTYKHLIQTDAAINPGNSGGPLVDLAGKLVGISSVKLSFTSQGTPTQGLGFAIPASAVAAKVGDFKTAPTAPDPTTASTKRGPAAAGSPSARRLFGLQLQSLTQELADAFGVRGTGGVLVADVERASPAQTAGIRQGMVVYKIGNYDVDSPAKIEALLHDVEGGTQVDFTLGAGSYAQRLNRGRQQVGTVTLTARE